MNDREVQQHADLVHEQKKQSINVLSMEIQHIMDSNDSSDVTFEDIQKIFSAIGNTLSENALIEFDGLVSFVSKSFEDVPEETVKRIVLEGIKHMLLGLEDRMDNYEMYYGRETDIDVEG